MTVLLCVVLGLVVAFMIGGLIYGYVHRNDPLTWDEAVERLKAQDCCYCTMCTASYVKWGRR